MRGVVGCWCLLETIDVVVVLRLRLAAALRSVAVGACPVPSGQSRTVGLTGPTRRTTTTGACGRQQGRAVASEAVQREGWMATVQCTTESLRDRSSARCGVCSASASGENALRRLAFGPGKLGDEDCEVQQMV